LFVFLFLNNNLVDILASVGKDVSTIKIRYVYTLSPNILIATPAETLEEYMSNMRFKNFRYLVIEDNENIELLISIKDLFR